MNITGFDIFDEGGNFLPSDVYGSYLAFNCYKCGYPVIAAALENHRGWDESHPAKCNGSNCNASYILDLRPKTNKLYVHSI